jgi:hypothetical protein
MECNKITNKIHCERDEEMFLPGSEARLNQEKYEGKSEDCVTTEGLLILIFHLCISFWWLGLLFLIIR